jgi:hypothetical protein
MSSSLSWLDHDAAAGERTMRLLEFFRQKEARDEMGIGGIRDAIADQLFPGTSTIQTRLRYFFFVPWLFQCLEARKVRAEVFPGEARRAEMALLAALMENEREDEDGVIGRNAGSLLKRLPSSVYWAGLRSWGIRAVDGSLQQYLATVDRGRETRKSRRVREDGEYHESDSTGRCWDAGAISLRSDDFPTGARLALTRGEAAYLLEKWQATHPRSLLTWLALHLRSSEKPPEANAIWRHPALGEFPADIRVLVEHGRKLDILTRGAALLYNYQLAQLDDRTELAEEYEGQITSWARDEFPSIADWDLARFWPLVLDKGHGITHGARTFVQEWLEVAIEARDAIAGSTRARDLIRARERSLKGAQSRFENVAVRRQWGGAAGTMPLTYRWPVARGYLRDWHAGWRSQ